jgi:phage terminase large subunit-like protein
VGKRAPSTIRNPSDELAIEQGCYFDPKEAARPGAFIERFCRQSQGRWANKPLVLLEWQTDFLRRLFGWRREDGRRRFERAYLEVAKKNGKSTMLSAIVLYLLLADDAGPKIFINACDRDQAKIIFDESIAMIAASPELTKRLNPIPSRNRIVYPSGNGYCQANSHEAPSKDGANASAVIFDELHRHEDRALWDVFEYAGAGRDEPLKLSITTAGNNEQGIWYEQRSYSEAVNRGEIPDTTHLGVVYRAEATDDIDSRETWLKANPSLGHTIREDAFARDLAEAKLVPTKLALFKRLRLNIITQTEAGFVTPEQWNACGSPHLQGDGYAPCWAGADLASTTDLAAVVWLLGDSSTGLDVRARFWLPSGRVEELERRDRVPYRAWIEQGFIELTQGDVIDYEAIRAHALDLAGRFDLRKLLLDPWNATQLAVSLKENDGLEVEFLRQGFASLSGPTKELERLIVSGQLRHAGNPVLRWMASNAVVTKDPAGNIKLDKAKSRNKIDGMAALVNAIAGMASDPTSGDSVYESRGILMI